MDYEMRMMPVDQICPADYNPRVDLEPGDPDWDRLEASVEGHGLLEPLVWNETTDRLVGGHQRLRVCTALGMDEVPVFVVHLSAAAERSANAALNKVHGRWDEDKLRAVLSAMDPKALKLSGFDPKDVKPLRPVAGTDFFSREEKEEDAHEDGNDEYNDFVDKFKTAKTTDDCYTPDNICEAVSSWVAQEYGRAPELFVRPFYPGGNYVTFDYPKGCTVVDNPPFSILAQIVDFYLEHGIPFFLFAPALTCVGTLRGNRRGRVCVINVGVGVTYENGARVNTSFVTSLEPGLAMRFVPELREKINTINDQNQKAQHAEHPKYNYPYNVLSGSDYRLSKYGQALSVPWSDCVFISALDAQAAAGVSIFGGGLLLTERAAAERAAAITWHLSDREIQLLRDLEAGASDGKA